MTSPLLHEQQALLARVPVCIFTDNLGQEILEQKLARDGSLAILRIVNSGKVLFEDETEHEASLLIPLRFVAEHNARNQSITYVIFLTSVGHYNVDHCTDEDVLFERKIRHLETTLESAAFIVRPNPLAVVFTQDLEIRDEVRRIRFENYLRESQVWFLRLPFYTQELASDDFAPAETFAILHQFTTYVYLRDQERRFTLPRCISHYASFNLFWMTAVAQQQLGLPVRVNSAIEEYPIDKLGSIVEKLNSVALSAKIKHGQQEVQHIVLLFADELSSAHRRHGGVSLGPDEPTYAGVFGEVLPPPHR
jgi:hypothetical protein